MSEDLTSRFSLRLPKELHERLVNVARRNSASLNTEMLRLIEKGMDHEFSPSSLDAALAELLPGNLLQRIRKYQQTLKLLSEAEAMRRLLKSALDEKEKARDILDELGESYLNERDIRVLARDILAGHGALQEMSFPEGGVWFKLNSGESGAIDKLGKLYYSEYGSPWESGMDVYRPRKVDGGLDEIGLQAEDDDLPF